MEVKFEKSLCSFLDMPLREMQSSEQTQEIKLPDGMPDIGSILCAHGQVILRSKEWRSSSVHFSGGMMVNVLYRPEDGSPERSISSWIPFQLRWELPEGTPEGKLRIQCLPRFVDARTVSARKIMVRAGISVKAEAGVEKSAEVCAPEGKVDEVELLETTYPLRLRREMGEKPFLLEEELTLPESAPHPKELIWAGLQPKNTEDRVISEKLVFRGSGVLHVLYRSEEGQLHGWDFELPYSQFAELERNHGGDARADILTEVTSMDVELDPEGHFHAKCGVVAQYCISDIEKLRIVEDAYSPRVELETEQETLSLPVILEERTEKVRVEQTVPLRANLVTDAWLWQEFPHQTGTEWGVEMELCGTVHTLCYGENSQPVCAGARWERKWKVKAHSGVGIHARAAATELQAAAGAGDVTIRADVPVVLTSETTQSIPMITGLKLGQKKAVNPHRPSLILRRAGEQRLWDIAKGSGSTMDAIRKANKLTGEPEPDKMLLIPVP